MTSKQSSATPLEKATASWPDSIKKEYSALKLLGKGGFASVVLAAPTTPDHQQRPKKAAIKVIRKDPKFGFDYAKREIDILTALPPHPNIMKLYDSAMTNRVALLVLEFCPGQSLDSILKTYGAPTSLSFCRVVTAQLVDAIAWLHSYSTLHRDIQPANIMVRGFDEETNSGAMDHDANTMMDKEADDWSALVAKWHITLIDFGFARALQSQDFKHMRRKNSSSTFQSLTSSLHNKNVAKTALNDPMTASQRRRVLHRKASSYVEKEELGKSLSRSKSGLGRSSTRSMGDSNGSNRLNRSASRYLVRSLSALGHRDYAAPEIKRGVHHQEPSEHSSYECGMDHTLSDNVSDYGMVADAFSAGATIRYLMSGVPPDQSISQTIAAHNSPAARAGRWVQRKMKGKKEGGTKKPKKHYRSDLPPEVVRLVKGLTQGSPDQRTTVRAARLYPWIDDVLLHDEGDLRAGRGYVHRPTEFLNFNTTTISATEAC